MYSKRETLERVIKWLEGPRVGNMKIFHPPAANMYDYFIEETIKLHEMNDEQRAAVCAVFDLFEARRVEMFSDKTGKPDRIKITRNS